MIGFQSPVKRISVALLFLNYPGESRPTFAIFLELLGVYGRLRKHHPVYNKQLSVPTFKTFIPVVAGSAACVYTP